MCCLHYSPPSLNDGPVRPDVHLGMDDQIEVQPPDVMKNGQNLFNPSIVHTFEHKEPYDPSNGVLAKPSSIRTFTGWIYEETLTSHCT